MDKKNEITLTPEDVATISSDYIREGRHFESWKINEVIIHEKHAVMDASMTSTYTPGSNKFHLSIYLAEEMASQLMIIYGHIWAGLTEKKGEVWMLESHTKSIRPVTKSENIKIEMNVKAMKKRGETIFGIGEYSITDDNNGLIELMQKGILS